MDYSMCGFDAVLYSFETSEFLLIKINWVVQLPLNFIAEVGFIMVWNILVKDRRFTDSSPNSWQMASRYNAFSQLDDVIGYIQLLYNK